MMREIKFRGWDSVSQDMVYQKGGQLGAGRMLSRFSEVMQYTGLKDKNGKEIYEGDIIEKKTSYNHGREGIGLVKYKIDNYSSGFTIELLKGDDWAFYFPDGPNWNVRELEVIGNKYEDGDLVESS